MSRPPIVGCGLSDPWRRVVVHCIPYSCRLSATACGKRHLAAIVHRTCDMRETAYPFCRRCPVGAENARATQAPSVSLERVRVSKLSDNPTPRAPETVPCGERCTMPGCDRLRCVPRPGTKPEFVPLCAVCRDDVHAMRRAHGYGTTLAVYVERLAARRAAR